MWAQLPIWHSGVAHEQSDKCRQMHNSLSEKGRASSSLGHNMIDCLRWATGYEQAQ